MIKSAGLVGDCFTYVNASLAKIRAADSGGGFPAVATLISQKRNLPLSAVPCGRWKSPNSCVACGCVASSHEREHPHPTQPKKLRSMRMCCKFSRTSTSPPHPTQPKKLRSMRMCCKFSRTSTSPPHPTQPKKLRSMRMCCKFSRTSTSPPHPTQPKKLRSMRMCCKFSRTSTSPPHPTQPKNAGFTKTLKTLARFSPR